MTEQRAGGQGKASTPWDRAEKTGSEQPLLMHPNILCSPCDPSNGVGRGRPSSPTGEESSEHLRRTDEGAIRNFVALDN